jgi:hypothetical protein
LLNTIFWVALLPAITFPKLKLEGFALSTELTAMPVPEKAIVCGEFGELLVITTPPLSTPAAVGANLAMKETDWFALTVTGVVSPLTEYPVPLASNEVSVSAKFPLLEIVTVCVVLPPTETFPKEIKVGTKEACACPPVPVSATFAGEAGSLLVILIEPDAPPTAFGEY